MFLHEMHEYWFGPGPSLIILTGVVKEVDDACRVHLVAVDEGDSEVGATRVILTADDSKKWLDAAVPSVVAVSWARLEGTHNQYGQRLIVGAVIVYS
jgi:hypothetical protein